MLAFAEASQWVRQNLDEAAALNLRWNNLDDADVMKAAMRNGLNDPRMTQRTVDMYQTKTIPVMRAAGRLPNPIRLDTAIDAQFINNAMSTGSEFFSDLSTVPEDLFLD